MRMPDEATEDFTWNYQSSLTGRTSFGEREQRDWSVAIAIAIPIPIPNDEVEDTPLHKKTPLHGIAAQGSPVQNRF